MPLYSQTNVQRVVDALCDIPNSNYKAISAQNGLGINYGPFEIDKMKILVNSKTITMRCDYGAPSFNCAFEYTFNVNDTEISEVSYNGKSYIEVYCGSGILRRYLYNGKESEKKTITSFYFFSEIPLLYKRFENGLLSMLKVVITPNAKISLDFNQVPSGMNVKKKKHNPSVRNVQHSSQYRNNQSDQITFKPTKATITDSQGSFTSSNFNCPNMVVYDKGNSVQLSWGGENISLYKGSSPDTYVASQSKSGTTMKFVAYRSSSTRQIYLVICTTKGNGKSVEINFKP